MANAPHTYKVFVNGSKGLYCAHSGNDYGAAVAVYNKKSAKGGVKLSKLSGYAWTPEGPRPQYSPLIEKVR